MAAPAKTSTDLSRLLRSAGSRAAAVAAALDTARKARATGGEANANPAKYAAENDLLQPIGQSKIVGKEIPMFDDGDHKAAIADTWNSNNKSIRYLYHDDEGSPIGAMQIRTHGPRTKKATIQNVYVADHARRQGVARKLLTRARQDFDVKHSDDLTNDGRAFAKAVKAHGGAVADALRVARATGGGVHTGAIHSSVAGRTDHLPMHVPSGSYVLPADIVSAMGEGNTVAGFKIAKKLPRLFAVHDRTKGGTPYGASKLPYGAVDPPHKASGGSTSVVPIVAAGGELVYSPEEVAMIGGGDLDDGHKILDHFVKQLRAATVKTLSNLPGPRRD